MELDQKNEALKVLVQAALDFSKKQVAEGKWTEEQANKWFCETATKAFAEANKKN